MFYCKTGPKLCIGSGANYDIRLRDILSKAAFQVHPFEFESSLSKKYF